MFVRYTIAGSSRSVLEEPYINLVDQIGHSWGGGNAVDTIWLSGSGNGEQASSSLHRIMRRLESGSISEVEHDSVMRDALVLFMSQKVREGKSDYGGSCVPSWMMRVTLPAGVVCRVVSYIGKHAC